MVYVQCPSKILNKALKLGLLALVNQPRCLSNWNMKLSLFIFPFYCTWRCMRKDIAFPFYFFFFWLLKLDRPSLNLGLVNQFLNGQGFWYPFFSLLWRSPDFDLEAHASPMCIYFIVALSKDKSTKDLVRNIVVWIEWVVVVAWWG